MWVRSCAARPKLLAAGKVTPKSGQGDLRTRVAISAGCFVLRFHVEHQHLWEQWEHWLCPSVPYCTLALGGVRGKSLLEHKEQRTPRHGKLKVERNAKVFLFLSICSLEATEYTNESFLLSFFPSFCVTFCLMAAAATWNLREKFQRTVITSGLGFGHCFYKRYGKSCLEKKPAKA